MVPYPVVGIGIRLRAGSSGVRPPVRAKGFFFLLQNVYLLNLEEREVPASQSGCLNVGNVVI